MPLPFAVAFLFSCFTALAACSDSGSDSPHLTELSVYLERNGSSQAQTVEFTVECTGTVDTVPENGLGFTGPVGGPWLLERVDSAPETPENVSMWQRSIELPPGSCSIDLRARDEDGEVVCTTEEPFTVNAHTTTNVNIVFLCDFRNTTTNPPPAPDNFCPDLVALSCGDIDAAATSCEVSFRDSDGTCGQGCDLQTCIVTPEGLVCTPGPDGGVSTTITCTNAFLDCTDDGIEDASCIIDASTAGVSIEILDGTAPTFTADFFVACLPPDLGGMPGATITCVAHTTDGDVDCDQNRTIDLDCPEAQASP